MGSGGKSGSSSDYYRDQEEARQAEIRAGTARIDAVFDGGTYGENQVSGDPVAGRTYYLADGTPYSIPVPEPAAGVGSGSGSSKSGGAIPLQDVFSGNTPTATGSASSGKDVIPLSEVFGGSAAETTPTLYSNQKTADGFGDEFFDEQRQAYLDYAMPQLEDQRADASRELTFSLARSGQLEGSAMASQQADLAKVYDIQAQDTASKALDYENTSRSNVESARADLVSMLSATGDADSTASAAIARADTLTQPTAYSPLSNLFSDFTGALGTADAASRARAYGWGSGGSSTTGGAQSFAVPTSAVTVRS